jgi:hypothetical protein
MNRAAQFIVCFCILATSALDNLTNQTVSAQSAGKQVLPKGCEKLLPGMTGDGFVSPPNHEPREIVVEMAKLSNENPVSGSGFGCHLSTLHT